MDFPKTSKAVETAGYIGLGSAGFSMASKLLENGFTVVVCDIDRQTAENWWRVGEYDSLNLRKTIDVLNAGTGVCSLSTLDAFRRHVSQSSSPETQKPTGSTARIQLWLRPRTAGRGSRYHAGVSAAQLV
ncbi:hypothetical protein EKO04_002978 [Ascochyta lentis]|uniref:6-phosphogluconate dehydrogenase NADP-binding domain-containing protein n=1 Tax=Ascochyta lentis TaxID=205686 RepID=A0A8H7MKT9_9PLEO|nr:hypothetical protein EKO04_002978 [Ascochyta lentis]